ncbi:exodeoxyribonuclease 7 large subunit [Actinomycetota bacterium]|nr:exodeoxyribonuclease 7 large subunit [Actinomycetota bacterium]
MSEYSDIPVTARDTSKENPWPLSMYSRKFAQHIQNAPAAWIEAEIVSLKIYPRGAYLKLKDLEEEAFLPASSFTPPVINEMKGMKEGAHVVFQAKPQFWVKRGEVSMSLMSISEVGVGDMLARIEDLKKKLAQEGLFAQEHKKDLPFLPRRIGLICGLNAQAKDDVLENVERRWAGIEFEVRQVSVGNSPRTPVEVANALIELDGIEDVDVIIIARGGGALEEVVIPFSDEKLVCTVFDLNTPVISAIGHETDCPLIDFVADFRASTPTDAAKNVVPSLEDEIEIIQNWSEQAKSSVLNRIERDSEFIDSILDRPTLKSPELIIDPYIQEIADSILRVQNLLKVQVEQESGRIAELSGKLTTLNFDSTLNRGFAIVYDGQGTAISSVKTVKVGDLASLKLSDGNLGVKVEGIKE